MTHFSFETAPFKNVGEQETLIQTWQGRYRKLIETLGQLGSQVKVERVFETDADIAPHNFMRGARHEFIFPPQDIKLKDDNSGVIDPAPGYSLRREAKAFKYNRGTVEGHVRLFYDDSNSRIEFNLTDLPDKRQIPPEALEVIEQAFTPPPES